MSEFILLAAAVAVILYITTRPPSETLSRVGVAIAALVWAAIVLAVIAIVLGIGKGVLASL